VLKTLLIGMVLLAGFLVSRSAQAEDLVGPQTVWTGVDLKKCSYSGNFRQWRDCLKQSGAPDATLDFAEYLESSAPVESAGIVNGFREFGTVDFAEIFFPSFANTNEQIAFVNGNAPVVMPREIVITNPPKTWITKRLIKFYPSATPSFRFSLVGYRAMPGDVQRFVVTDVLVDGCRACEAVGTSIIFIDFKNGALVSSRSMAWVPKPTMEASRKILRGKPRARILRMSVLLTMLGYDVGQMDGVLGESTGNALDEFRRDHCLTIRGELDSDTARAILKADGFSAPCNGVTLPSDDSAVPSDEKSTTDSTSVEIERVIRGYGNQGIVFAMTIGVRRSREGAMIRLKDATGTYNPEANFNAVEAGADFPMSFQVVTRKDCEGCTAGFSEQSPEVLRFTNDRIVETSLPVEVFIPNSALDGADLIDFGLIGWLDDHGIVFLTPDEIMIADLYADHEPQDVEGLASRISGAVEDASEDSADSSTTEARFSDSSPISDGTYINTSAFGGVPGHCAEATIPEESALRVVDGKLNFNGFSCQVLGNTPSSQTGYATLFLQCSGEEDQWKMENLFQVTSESTFELGGEQYQGCLGREWVATDDANAPPASAPGGGPSSEDIARALVGNDVILQHITRISVTISDCVPQEEVRRPGFRGPFWACSFSVTEAVFKNSAPAGWDEWRMLTGSAETRFVHGVRTGVTQWTQRFAQSTNGAWGVQMIWR
jgi:hypothetical protein